MQLQEEGLIHRRLMQNRCPKCEQSLQVIEKTEENLTRKCQTCQLTIQDKVDQAEGLHNICD